MKLQKNAILIIMIVIIVGGLIFFTSGKKSSETKNTADLERKEKISFKEAIGKKAPDFELESITGEKIKLSDYLGKKNVVLFFNEGSMCYPACWNQIAVLA